MRGLCKQRVRGRLTRRDRQDEVDTNAKAHGATAHAFFDVSFDGRHVLSHWIGQPGPRDPAWREAGDSLTDAACLSLSPGTLPMTSPGPIRVTLLVLYTPQLEECRNFYARLGLAFTTEQHGHGPEHFAAVLADGTVFELYPSTPGRQTNTLRLGLAIEGNAASPPLDKGHHQVTDPDGRTVEVLAS